MPVGKQKKKMASILYLRNTQSRITGYYDMDYEIGASTDTGVVTTTASGTEIQWTKTAGGTAMAWISRRIETGFTLTTATANIWAIESAASVNAGGRCRIFKYSGGVETELGGGPFDDGVEFSSMSNTLMTWTANVTDTAFAKGDRIIVKFYATNQGTMGAGTATLTFNNTNASSANSNLTLNENVVFQGEYPTIALNTADATDFGSDTTPTLEMTATDDQDNDVSYNVQIDTVNTFDSQSVSDALIDYYIESNQSSGFDLNGPGVTCGQSFLTGNAATLKSVKVYLKKTGSPTGNLVTRLLTHSGTYGLSSVPTGVALATADNFDVSTLTTSYQLITITFSGANQYAMSANTNYCLTVGYAGSGTNFVTVGYDNTYPDHRGNFMTFVAISWGASPTSDMCFYVYADTNGPLLDKVSDTDTGFVNTVTGGDTDPFNSGEKASFTVQVGDALSPDTYYWRARAVDPVNSTVYSDLTTARSFTISAAASVTPNLATLGVGI